MAIQVINNRACPNCGSALRMTTTNMKGKFKFAELSDETFNVGQSIVSAIIECVHKDCPFMSIGEYV